MKWFNANKTKINTNNYDNCNIIFLSVLVNNKFKWNHQINSNRNTLSKIVDMILQI